MNSRREAKSARVPTLVPLHGNFEKKPRPLDRDVSLIGRARGCDLCLDASDVSTLHCVVFRTRLGYRIRDCNSRTGTRVNGEAVQSSALNDGDVLNIGPFSFEVKVPHGLSDPEGLLDDPARVTHWQDSRRRLAERALWYRRQLRHLASHGTVGDEDLQRKALALREQIRQYDQRAGQLEEAEQELARDRDELARNQEALRSRVHDVESEIARRLADADEEIKRRWQEFQQQCQAAEQARSLREAVRVRAGADGAPDDEVKAELARLTAEFQEQQRKLADRQRQLDAQADEAQRDRQEFNRMKQQWENSTSTTSAELEQQKAALAHQAAQLHNQKAELARMMNELRKMQEDFRKQQKGDARALLDENQRLKDLVGEYEQRLEVLTTEADINLDRDRELANFRAETERLREALAERDQRLAGLQAGHAPESPAGVGDEPESLRRQVEQLVAENEALKQLLQEKSSLVEQLHQKPAPKPGKNAGELERYEAELNQFGQQLEADRARLSAEMDQLRARNQELDEATREMEMQMSRERAEMARERMRLDRMREELRTDMEKLQREAAVRDSLASVNKLRGELAKKPG